MTIYSIGYQKLELDDLKDIAEHFDAIVVDVRSVPSSRKKGFSRKALDDALGPFYVFKGDQLGGRAPGVTPAGIEWLKKFDQNIMLLCMEEAPGDCHRHHDIATRLLPSIDVTHIYQNELIQASALQRAIDNDTDYSCRLFSLPSRSKR